MNIKTIFLAVVTAMATATIPLMAKAQTVNARCDIYPAGVRKLLVSCGE